MLHRWRACPAITQAPGAVHVQHPNPTPLQLPWPATSPLAPPVTIGSQGPLHPDYHGPDTCGDFWHAVTANGVGTIVALAKVSQHLLQWVDAPPIPRPPSMGFWMCIECPRPYVRGREGWDTCAGPAWFCWPCCTSWLCVHPVPLRQVQPGFSGSSQYFPTADKREFVFDGLRVSLVEETELSADVVSWHAVVGAHAYTCSASPSAFGGA